MRINGEWVENRKNMKLVLFFLLLGILSVMVNGVQVNVTGNGTTIVVTTPTDVSSFVATNNFSQLFSVNDTIQNNTCQLNDLNVTLMRMKLELNTTLLQNNDTVATACAESRFIEIFNATRDNGNKLSESMENMRNYITTELSPKQERLSLLEGNLSDCNGKLTEAIARINNTIQGLSGKDQQIDAITRENKSLSVAAFTLISIIVIFLATLIAGAYGKKLFGWRRGGD